MPTDSEAAFSDKADEKILRRKQVENRVGLSCSTIYAGIAAGTFPKPIQLGAQSVGWLESEISAWLRNRIAISRDPLKALAASIGAITKQARAHDAVMDAITKQAPKTITPPDFI